VREKLFRTPGFQHVIEQTVVHERAAVRFLLNLAVFVGGIEKFLDIFISQETMCDSLRMGRGPKRPTRLPDPGVTARFLLNLAVFVGGVETLLDIFISQETLCDSLRMERGPKKSTRFA